MELDKYANLCEVVDVNTWERRANFEFFSEFLNPNVGITVHVDASRAFARAKENGGSFFLRYFHSILRAANEIPEFHYRIDRQRRVLRYERIDGLAPIRLKGMTRFAELRFRYHSDYGEFVAAAHVTMERAATTEAYSADNSLSGFDMILVSAVPDLAFTAVNGTVRNSTGNDYPLMTVGKMGDDGMMPIALSIHHALVDGYHVSRLFSLIQKFLDE